MNKFSPLLLVILIGLILALSAPSSAASQFNSSGLVDPAHTPFAPGVVLVGLKSNTAPAITSADLQAGSTELGGLLAGLNVKTMEPVFPAGAGSINASDAAGGSTALDFIYRLRLPANSDVLSAVAALQANPDVAYAEPDYLAHALVVPNDPLYAQQWALSKINAPVAWNTTTGSTDIVIAVVDAGLDMSHPDLAGQMWTNPGEIAGNGIDDDYNGKVDDINGWNIIGNNADLSDNTGHGSQVAGVIAAKGNNGQGIAGVCWLCRLMVVKVMQPGGVANYSDIAAGIAYAAQKGADVINLSLGGSADSATLRAAIAAAAETAVIVGGAGNDNSSAPFYPAAYDDYVLAVAGTDSGDVKVATSNFGPWVDVAAPGEDIMTTLSSGGYGAASGTSVAAPFASGLAGLLLSQHPDWPAAQVRAHIRQTANNIDAVNPGYAGQLGGGRVNALNGVATPAQPLLTYTGYKINGIADGRPEPGSTVELEVTLYNAWGQAANVQASLATADPYVTLISGSSSYGDIGSYASGSGASPFRFSLSAAAPYAHTIGFTLNLAAAGGYAATIPFSVATSPGVSYVHGSITTQTWTSDRTYIIDNEAGVPAGQTLTIQPGTTIRFAGLYSLVIAGTLIADGTADQPIRFTSNKPNPAAGNWNQIRFEDSSVDASFDGSDNYTGGSIIRHAVIEYGQGLGLNSAAPYIADSTFRHLTTLPPLATAYGSGLWASNSNGIVITGNDFSDTGINISASSSFSILRNTISGGSLVAQGSGVVAGNSVSASSTCIVTYGGVVQVTGNRVTNCTEGMRADAGIIEDNLLANNNTGLLITGGTSTVSGNTIVFNSGPAVHVQNGAPVFHQNNLIGSTGQPALRNDTANAIDAGGNWWGSAGDSAIQAAIHDGLDEFGLGIVNYSSYLAGPYAGAPAYTHNVTIAPDTTLGLQQATFDVEFSRPMDQTSDPALMFHTARRGTQQNVTAADMGLPNTTTIASTISDKQGNIWVAGTGVARYDGTTWTAYTRSSAGIPTDYITELAADSRGVMWFKGATYGVPDLVRFDGTAWTRYSVPDCPGGTGPVLSTIAVDQDDFPWVACYSSEGGGKWLLGRFNGSSWTTYTTSNIGPGYSWIVAFVIDHNGHKWLGTPSGVVRFDGTNWTTYTTSNSGLPDNSINDMAVDVDGSVWFATKRGIAHYHDGNWTVYYPGIYFNDISINNRGVKWFVGNRLFRFDGTTWQWQSFTVTSSFYVGMGSDRAGNVWLVFEGPMIFVYYGHDYPITGNTEWLSPIRWRASYDVTSLVPRGVYTLTVSSARGANGMEIPIDTRFNFTVDYAGQITDQTPPPAPAVIAGGRAGDPSTVEGLWLASDPESGITAYRYAIGSAPGAVDIVNWNTTASTTLTKSGLGLVDGRQYWLSVQAQNAGGLWSASGYGSFVAGQPMGRVFLPVVIKSQ